MNSFGKLPNYRELDGWRIRRNDIGHKTSGLYAWIELDGCLNEVFKALNHLEILSENPQYDVYKTTQRVPPSELDIEIEQSVTIEVTDRSCAEKRVVKSFEWRIQVRDGSVTAVHWNKHLSL